MDNKEVKNDVVKENSPKVEIPKMAQPENKADFSKIFNVASEENVEVPKMKEPVDSSVKEQPVEQEVPKKVEKKASQFNGEEKVLYEIKPETESSPVVPAMFFAVLITAILILPYVASPFDFSFVPTPVSAPPQAEETDEFFYFNKSSVRAKIGELEFTNFVKSNIDGEYRISFNVSNTALKTYQFDKKYFVVLYDENENVVFRSLIHSYESLGAMAAQSLTLNVTENAFKKADRFKIAEIPVSTYPEVKLIEKEGEYEVLQCTYKNNEIKYYFLNNQLAKIYDVYTEKKESNNNYERNKSKYKEYSNKYKTVPNFSSIFIETEVEFQMINEFDLKKITDAQLTSLKTYRFFTYNESKDVVSFELESQGYTCS